ncbi:MAG TPA: phospholipase [Pseudonocardiaceae bacterium]|nr:phospholipase [Pseudonocardiaceae bacterium]
MTGTVAPMITRWGSRDPDAPLIVVFQGSDSFGDALGGSSEADLAMFARCLPGGAAYAAVRVPGPDLAAVRSWIDQHRAPQVPVVLVGVGGGAAVAGGLLLADPTRFAAAALLYGTLPFDSGLPMTRGRLAGVPVFLTHGVYDLVIPVELQRRTWDYLVRESGSPLWAQRQAGGHELTPETVSSLAGWIEARLGFLQWATPVADTTTGQARWPILPDGRLPERRGEPPEVSVTTPQQQQSQNAPAELQEALFDRIVQLDSVATAPSAISVPGARAFILCPGGTRGSREAFIVPDLGEFAHLHPGYDGSLHLALPVRLAHDALVKGWAVAHPLAGLRLTAGMVMIFGPRDAAELEIVTAIVRASHAYATGNRAR